jgi:hypothetical protein
MSLHFLDLLQYEHFRKEITNGQCAKFIEDQQLLHWQHYIRKRTRLLQAATGSDTLPSTPNPKASTTTAGLTALTGPSTVSTQSNSTSALPPSHSSLSNGTTFMSASQSSSIQIMPPK